MIAAHERRGLIRDQLCLQLEAIPADKTFVEDQAKLLGPLFVEENLLAPEQLERALRFSRNTGLPLDQIVVAEFPISQPDISRLLGEVSRSGDEGGTTDAGVVVGRPNRPAARIHLRRPIGQIFVDLGFITPDDREAALTVQRENGGLLGEILITQGKITRLELANALSEHWESATGARRQTANQGPSLIDVPRGDESSRRVEPSDAAELRRLLAELEAARVAAVQAQRPASERSTRLLPRSPRHAQPKPKRTRIANDELRERLDELIALRAADSRRSEAAHSQAANAAAEASRIEQTLAGALAALAVQVDDLAHRLDDLAPRSARSDRSARRTRRSQSADDSGFDDCRDAAGRARGGRDRAGSRARKRSE